MGAPNVGAGRSPIAATGWGGSAAVAGGAIDSWAGVLTCIKVARMFSTQCMTA